MNKPMLVSRILRAVAVAAAFALAWAPTGGGLAAAAPTAETSKASPTGARVAPRKATPGEIESYSTREKKASPDLASFAGGDRTVLVVSSTGVIIVLLIVLVAILI